MRLHAVYSYLIILLIVFFVSGCSKKEEPKPGPSEPAVAAMGERKTLFEQKCGVCHDLDRATARTETKEKWSTIIKEMQGKRADWITDDDAARVLDYLTSAYGK
ncbi:MAG: photosystem P840 reaction-center cytochrome c-551 [Deltaproteobacteria bacterium]|nr:photosystem P840 reaction-center cytochrome c-551 [Deltaproteobacteria bacterium]